MQHKGGPEDLLVTVETGGRRCALPAHDVVEIQPIVLVGPLPSAPAVVSGVIEVRGEVVAVIDLGVRFGLGPRTTRLDDRLVIVDTPTRRLALHVGHDVDLVAPAPDQVPRGSLPEAPYASGIVVTDDGLVIVHDLDALLSSDEEVLLGEALAHHAEVAR